MWFNGAMFNRPSLKERLMNNMSAALLAAAGAMAIAACSIVYFRGRMLRSAPPAITPQQAASLIQNVRFGKSTVNQEVYWLCHLLDGKSSRGVPFRRHQCQWQAAKLSPGLWRIEYDDRSATLDGRPTATDKIWLLDTTTWEIQPRTITTLMVTAPELAGVSSKKDLSDRFLALTGRPYAERSSTMNQEIDTLPRWRISRDATLARR
jgi:hypothetical protein